MVGKDMEAKTVSFMLMMGVLGNVLFAISSYLGNLGYGVALDFSLVAAYIAGFYGGPVVGFISGLFVGIMPGIVFGPMGMGSWLGLFGLPLGKGLTGLTAGIASRGLSLGDRQYPSLLAIPTTLLAYIPECLFTYAYFGYLMPFFLGQGGSFIFLSVILPKAVAEVTIIGFLIAALVGNHGFNDFVGRFFVKPHIIPKFKAGKSKLKT